MYIDKIKQEKLFKEFKGLQTVVGENLLNSSFKVQKIFPELLGKCGVKGSPGGCGTHYWVVFKNNSVKKSNARTPLRDFIDDPSEVSFIIRESGFYDHDEGGHYYQWTLFKATDLLVVLNEYDRESLKELYSEIG